MHHCRDPVSDFGVAISLVAMSRWQVLRDQVRDTLRFLRRVGPYVDKVSEQLAATAQRCAAVHDRVQAANSTHALARLWHVEVEPLLRDTSRMLAGACKGSRTIVNPARSCASWSASAPSPWSGRSSCAPVRLTRHGDELFFLKIEEVFDVLGGDTRRSGRFPVRRATFERYRFLPPTLRSSAAGSMRCGALPPRSTQRRV